ncbi:MAG: polysaccharide deacetylase [Clostridia bacterium]|nr:polysaccharide deacetylase [Clostridia bacterium]
MEEYLMPKQSKVKKFFRPLSVKVLCVILAAFVAAVSILSFKLYENHNKTVEANTTISETNDALKQINEELEGLKGELEKIKNEKATLEGELKTSKSEKEKLEKKIKELEKKLSKYEKKETSEKKSEKLSNETKKYPSIKVPIKNNGKKVCYLTFDDGPSKNTLKIIDILDAYGIKATFFVTCTGKTEYIKNIQKSGNAIGLHTASHNYSKIYKSEKAYFADLNSVSAAVEKYAGIKSTIIRFPGGSSNSISKNYSKNLMKKLAKSVEKKGYDYFDWNVDSGDASKARPTASYIMSRMKSAVGSQDKICVLMHDSAAKTGTVDALPQMIEWLVSKGYRFEVLTNESPTFHHGIS